MTPRIDALSLVVSDMAASVAFYRRLGLDFPEGSETEGHAEAPMPGGLRFMLDSEAAIRSFAPDFVPRSAHGRAGFAFKCESPAQVDATYSELTDAGYKGAAEPWDAGWGQRYAQIEDPDGQTVDLFAPLAG
ncbi:Glyoxalase/Bleomycin resistance protein/Dioxygenase superfamily protein [Streptomyces sp. YIM 130001]|uniref:VOC family protein n=1 Tax=Streptomyces sp. YIM 130001 TaxID=2259644 RepID=UPI000E65979F|nr:VOC family protein [Streptomyces sp. YIM 130001]RII17628.1 Glyoxalase/Bleomycin resistance protein/Dioxygenase superfamily protein [Streptomyces sp. YIM 130001]